MFWLDNIYIYTVKENLAVVGAHFVGQQEIKQAADQDILCMKSLTIVNLDLSTVITGGGGC